MAETLMEKTHRLLKKRLENKSLPDVHAELHAQGSDITFYWLGKFSRGEVKDPSVNRVEQLYRYLTGKSATITA